MLSSKVAHRLPSQAFHHRFLFPRARLSSYPLRWSSPGSATRLSSTMTEDEPIAYNWIRGVESIERYTPGGYHPVMVGDTLHKRYRIVDKLGSGGYSTVWLAHDDKLDEYVAPKCSSPRDKGAGSVACL
ncbi:hypothetical protein BJX68DRAFT_247849 [Aspergillus pseudodeflectus]|uniref:non-specific serine/threonine protein kinase n=1 Tax=Aspergillus pseudodeflectus TaxID=176178 RepID=A0ABR4JHE7_9EURO